MSVAVNENSIVPVEVQRKFMTPLTKEQELRVWREMKDLVETTHWTQFTLCEVVKCDLLSGEVKVKHQMCWNGLLMRVVGETELPEDGGGGEDEALDEFLAGNADDSRELSWYGLFQTPVMTQLNSRAITANRDEIPVLKVPKVLEVLKKHIVSESMQAWNDGLPDDDWGRGKVLEVINNTISHVERYRR